MTCNIRVWFETGLQYTEYLIRGVFFLLSLRVYLKAHSFVFTILLIILIIFGKPCKNMSMGNPQRLCDFIRSQNLCLGTRKRDFDVLCLLFRRYSSLTARFIVFVLVFHLLANFNAIGDF